MKIIPALCLVAFLGFNYTIEAQQDGDSIISHLNSFLDQWHKDAAEANHDAYIGAMTPGGVYIGTDATEYWTTESFSTWSKPYFDRGRAWTFNSYQRNIYPGPGGNIAWFDELLETQMGICRGSGVIVNHFGKWKIAQYVLSATIPNSIMKKVTIMKSGTDSALILGNIFDKNCMTGTILICDPANERYLGYNHDRWDSGYLPASTFKIPNTMIGLETGVIDTGYIFRWKGDKRRLPQWEQDLTLRDALRVSCVPCYQEVARRIGFARMKKYLAKFNYGTMDVGPKNIDLFWLEGKSRITPRQQADFMRRLYEEKLPVSKSTSKAIKSIMVIENKPGYILSGKTGWAIRNGNNYGWFTGYLETNGKVYFVTTLVEPKDQQNVDDFAAARTLVTMEVLRNLGLIPDE